MNKGDAIAICFISEYLKHRWLVPIRIASRRGRLGGSVVPVDCFVRLEDAIACLKSSPGNTVLVAVGFQYAHLLEYLDATDVGKYEIILHQSSFGGVTSLITSSLFERGPVFTRGAAGLELALRKARNRLHARQRVMIKGLETCEEVREYLGLRYRVWKELGYLVPESSFADLQIELDFHDRCAEPLGMFSLTSGKLVGCARLIRPFGLDVHPCIQRMEEIAQNTHNERLLACLEPPEGHTPDFDVLSAFHGFSQFYRPYVIQQQRCAEVSRVIVDKSLRGIGLGEVLVDSLRSFAAKGGFDVLFLACRKEHGPFYKRSGFTLIPGMESDHFYNIDATVVAMQQRLRTQVRV